VTAPKAARLPRPGPTAEAAPLPHPGAAAAEPDEPAAPAPSFDDLIDVARAALAAAAARGRTIATAESCTGGLVGHALTEVPGSSAMYRGGVIAYANEMKVALLDVDPGLLERHGAVSAEVAAAMATGARRRLRADVAVAVTGVAGPDGGTPEKPVGLAYVCTVGPEGVRTRRLVWSCDRAGNKRASAGIALLMLRDAATGGPDGPDADVSPQD